MITAKEANELTTKAIEKEKATREKRAFDFCEGIGKQIEESSNKGHNTTTITNIPANICELVVNIIRSNCYSVRQLNTTTITIAW